MSVYAAIDNAAELDIFLDEAAWARWLGSRIDHAWRPGEWDSGVWLFTGEPGNPMTRLWTCAVRSCTAGVDSAERLCGSCRDDLSDLGHDRAEFIVSYVPNRITGPAQVSGACRVQRAGVHCGRPAVCQGICSTHYANWRSHQERTVPPEPFQVWLATAPIQPHEALAPCLVLGCPNPVKNSRGLCSYHYGRIGVDTRRLGVKFDAREWAPTQTPYLGTRGFSLVPVEPLVRLEILYGLQWRDVLQCSRLSPKRVRALVKVCVGWPTLLGRERQLAELFARTPEGLSLVRHLCWSLRLAREEFFGIAAGDKEVLDLRAVGLKSTSRSGRRKVPGVADLTQIPQAWLRALLRAWVDAEQPTSAQFGRRFLAARVAGETLGRWPSGGHDLTVLKFAEMTAVVDGFRAARRLDGELRGANSRRCMLNEFSMLIDFGRGAGLLEGLSGGFTRHTSHKIKVDEVDEDEIGEAVPETIIRQLDAHLGSLGEGVTFGRLSPDDVKTMFQTIYVILRDTGRRPWEIASLATECLEDEGGEASLIWNDKKSRRYRRRLPITPDTAEVIRAWRGRRALLPAPPGSAAFLFPAITDTSGIRHMPANHVSLALRAWISEIPTLHTDTTEPDGDPLPFDRSKIFPYAFRHSYAQRHADAGTPLDVLRELMDHKSVQTTMGYYKVSLKRKREAVKTLSAHVVDREGKPTPLRSDLAYERSSVAVPFGGCTEPSNVKAGGGACRIRFQCAGCGFYRPDPSYLTAIEQQINDLRADRETAEAMNAAEFVIRNLTEQINAYRDVVTTMHTKLAQLPADERAEIEEASAVMRRTRAGNGHIMLPLSVTKPEDTQP